MVKTTIEIEGMMCGMCESHINDVIRKTVPGAKKVSASHKKNQATFVSDEEVNPEEIQAAIEDTGYHYISISSQPYEKKGLFGK